MRKTAPKKRRWSSGGLAAKQFSAKMANNEKCETKPEQSEKNEVLEELNSQKRKFDKIAEKLQSIEETVSKIAKLNDDEEKSMMKFKEQIESLEKSNLLNDRSNEKLVTRKSFVVKYVFENLEKYKFDISKEEEHFSMNWHMEMQKNNGYLGIYLFAEPIPPFNDDWSIEAKLEFKMIGKNNSSVIKTGEGIFEGLDGNGFDDFLKWEEMREDYLIDNKLTVEVNVEILKRTGFGKNNIREFDESQKEVSDVILVVQDTKFYVQKMYLALQSSYFKALFFGKFNESEKSEIELKDIEADDFQNFLELIHGESSVDDDTVTGILNLADMYDSPTAIRRCEEFLLKKSKKSTVQKLQLALRCNLEHLKNKCLSKITTISDIKSIMAANLPEMDLSTSQALLQKSLGFWDE
ncbi:hypothetical protein B9Z55_006905 [Caenorhabditis nigoni]|uniref:BTB domain-containing protein n=1 Tax=Caenorhabditis nigoni TaxID=1611254 RepID=A0A2G5V749_9PELO|nr:hypothetical protein B9Z55_006905 [Caenorhabditis nigoni]